MDYINNLAREFEKVLNANQLYHETYGYDTTVICVEIIWGDWKHDHLAVDWWAEQFFKSKGLKYESWYELVEEDGSDTYSANRYFRILSGE